LGAIGNIRLPHERDWLRMLDHGQGFDARAALGLCLESEPHVDFSGVQVFAHIKGGAAGQ